MKNSTDIEFTKSVSAHRAKLSQKYGGWYQEYLDSGAQYRMTYPEFKRAKSRKIRRKKPGKR